MDFSIIVVFPLSALIAFTTVIGVALSKRSKPRLLWPFAFSTMLVGLQFVGPPEMTRLAFWFLEISLVALWAAFGTIFGAFAARLAISAIRWLARQTTVTDR